MSALKMNKVTELIKSNRELTYSFEVTPDVHKDELRSLSVSPLFFSVTWHARSHQCESLNIDPLRTTRLLLSMHKHVLLHLSCDMLRTQYLNELLTLLQEKGVCNLFLILGDGYDSNTTDFKSTSELIKYIREKTGQYFCIGVTGFPGCTDEKLLQTKEKIDSGADFIITQAFFKTDVYVQFKEKCKRIGIRVPIIPGVFAFETHKQLTGFVNICKIKVAEELLQYVENKDKLNIPCIDLTKQLLQNLTAKYGETHIHFFTLNKFKNISTLMKQLE